MRNVGRKDSREFEGILTLGAMMGREDSKEVPIFLPCFRFSRFFGVQDGERPKLELGDIEGVLGSCPKRKLLLSKEMRCGEGCV